MKRIRTGADIRAARKVMKMTQVQLAAALRIEGADSGQTIRRWEKSESPNTVATVAIEALCSGWRPAGYKP